MIKSFKTDGTNTESVLSGMREMHMRSKSRITIDVGRRLPQNRPPTHPGEMLLEEFIKPLNLTRTEIARRLEISDSLLDDMIQGKCSVTPDTALRLGRVFGMSADFWLGLQQDWDLWHAMHCPEAEQINALQPLPMDHNVSA